MAQRQVQIVRELTRKPHFLEGKTYVDCEIVGPAVLAVDSDNTFEKCAFPGPFEVTFWTLPEKPVAGPILLNKCTFRRCTFAPGIGIAGTAETIAKIGVEMLS